MQPSKQPNMQPSMQPNLLPRSVEVVEVGGPQLRGEEGQPVHAIRAVGRAWCGAEVDEGRRWVGEGSGLG